MLRTTRPLLSSANRLAVAGRVPHVRPTQLPTCAVLAPQARPQLHKQAAAGQSKAFPIVFWARYSSKVPLQPTKIDKQHEKELAQQKLEARPDEVSGVSSVRPLLEESQAPKPPPDEDPLRGLKGDLVRRHAQLTHLEAGEPDAAADTNTKMNSTPSRRPLIYSRSRVSHTPLASLAPCLISVHPSRRSICPGTSTQNGPRAPICSTASSCPTRRPLTGCTS